MRNRRDILPPRLAGRFLKWYCREDIFEEIEGDAQELFAKRLKEDGRTSATRNYWWDVLRFFRYSNLKFNLLPKFNNNPNMLNNYILSARRNLQKNKLFALINIAGLVAGISGFFFLSILAYHELSYDEFHAKKDRIVRVALDFNDAAGNTRQHARVGAPWGPALNESYAEIETYVRFRFAFRTLVAKGEMKIYETDGLFVDPAFFDVFNFNLIAGDKNTVLAKPNSIVLNQSLAKKYFGDADPIGQYLRLDNQLDTEVTGIIEDPPGNSHFKYDFLLPFALHASIRPDWMDKWTRLNYHTYLLLDEPSSIAQLDAKLPDFIKKNMDPEDAPLMKAVLQPITDIHLTSHRSSEFEANGNLNEVRAMIAIACFILAIAGFNYINFATAKVTTRVREVGLRKAIGATSSQISRQLLTETAITTTFATMLSILVLWLLWPAFNQLIAKNILLPVSELPFLAGALVLIIVLTLLTGYYPALILSRFTASQALTKQTNGARFGLGMRQTLVGLQLFVSMLILIGLGVVLLQVNYIRDKDLGFEKADVVTIPFASREMRNAHETVYQQLYESPAIISAATSSGNLGGGDWGTSMVKEGGNEIERVSTRMLNIDYNFAELYKLEVLNGRTFSKDYPSDSIDAFVINEAAAEVLDMEEAVGQRIEIPGWRRGEVIGVVRDFHFRSLHHEIAPLLMFVVPENFQALSIKINPNQRQEAIAHIEKVWNSYTTDSPFQYQFLEDSLSRRYVEEERKADIIALFGVLAMFIAALGLFGMIMNSAQQRLKEIGVRKVLGASVIRVTGLFIKELGIMLTIAAAVSIPIGAYLMTTWLQSFAYRTVIDWRVFVLATCSVALLAILTVGYHALKAARTSPVKTLRHE